MNDATAAVLPGAFKTAVFGAAPGCHLLLLRKSVAYYIFIVSLPGMRVTMSHTPATGILN